MSALLAGLLVVLVGCSGGSSDPDGDSAPGPTSTQAVPSDPPGIVDDDGFYRANTLPEPIAETVVTHPGETGEHRAKLQILSLDSDGQSARLVGAWLFPTEGEGISFGALSASQQGAHARPWIRLVDRAAGTLSEPLQMNGYQGAPDFGAPAQALPAEASSDSIRKAACICSYTHASVTSGGPDDPTRLFFVDFPAPASDSVSVLPGDWIGLIDDVPVSEGTPFDQGDPELSAVSLPDGSSEFPAEYGGGSEVSRVLDLESRTESVTGASVDRGEGGVSLNLQADVLFEVDSDELDGDAQEILDDTVEVLKATAAGTTVTIEGHTDDQGEEDYNQGLSERRAESVRAAIEDDLAGSSITLETRGFGETDPVAPNTDGKGSPIEANRALNRRVSFTYDTADTVDPAIDTGERIEDLPEMDDAGDHGGLASGILAAPGDSKAADLRIDVRVLEERGDDLYLEFGFATADGATDDSALDPGNVGSDELHFGVNGFALQRFEPQVYDVKVWDRESSALASPISAQGADCLCAQSSALGVGAMGDPTAMWAYFPKDRIESDTLTLRFAEAGQMEVPVGSAVADGPSAAPPSSGGATAGPTGAAGSSFRGGHPSGRG
ncbi:outer membrane protein OmpA-like peptidoglycan-associated protein [Brevibacterium pityocampae]